MKLVILIGGCLAWAGCAGLQAAQGGVGQAQGELGKAKGEADKTAGEIDKNKKKGGGNDGGGGGEDDDGDRLHAKDAPINQPIDDKVDGKKGDRYDWRKVVLGGKPGIATFELHWDEESANVDIDVYDKFGTNIGKSPPRLEGQQMKRVLVQIDEPGLYYVRVSAPTPNDTSIYTMAIRWKGPGGAPPPAVATPTTPATTTPTGGNTATPATTQNGTPAAPSEPVPLAQDPTKLLASIVSAHKEGSAWVLYLDRGAAQKVFVGMSGHILEGPEGDKLLEGATLTVSQVIDGNKAIARSNFPKPLGKNKRVVLNLK